MKKKLIIILGIVVVIVCLIMAFIFRPKTNVTTTKANNETQFKTQLTDFTDGIFKGNLSYSDIEQMTNQKFSNADIIIGKDSYIRQKLSGSNLADYSKAQDKYASLVEKTVKDNFDYKIENVTTSVDKEVIANIKFKSYYYVWYLTELQMLQTKLMNLKGYNDQSLESKQTNQLKIDSYKSLVKSMEIMNNHLDKFINKNEYIETSIIYNPNDQKRTGLSYMSYLLELSGRSSANVKLNDSEFVKNMNTDVDSYINEATANGTLNNKNPLKLK